MSNFEKNNGNETTTSVIESNRVDISPETQNSPEAKEITQKAKDKLANQETQLTGKSLSDIGKTQSEALALAKTTLSIADPLDIKELKRCIKKYQKENNLIVDGKIGKQTYMEMFIQSTNEKIKTSLSLGKLAPEVKEDILFSLENNFSGNKTKQILTLNLIKIRDEFPTEKEFLLKIDSSVNIGAEKMKKDPEIQAEIEKAQNTVIDGKTVYEHAKEGNIKAILKDPTLLMGAGLLFLFGVFGSDSKMTDSIWKRLAILIAIPVFGSKLGFGKMVDDILPEHETMKKAGTAISNTASEIVSSAPVELKTFTLPEWVTNLGITISDTVTDGSEAIKGSYNKVMGNISATNDVNEESNPEKYIKDFTTISKTINNDKAFNNKKIEDLESNNNDINAIKMMLSDSVKSSLFPASLTGKELEQRNKDVLNYISLILEEKEDGKDFDISELFYEKSIIDEFKNILAKNNKGYIENNYLNNQIKIILGNIDDEKVKNELMFTLSNQGVIEDSNNQDNFDKLEKYLSDNSNLDNEIKSKIEKIKAMFASEIVLENAIALVSTIKIIDNNSESESQETIIKKIKKLEDVKDLFNSNIGRLSDSDNSKFDTVYTAKILELKKKGAELGITEYSNEITNLEKTNKINQDKEILNNLSIPDVPKVDAKPKEFAEYWNENKESFETAEKYKVNEDDSVKDLAGEILEKKSKFKRNYEVVKGEIVNKIALLSIKIGEINTQEGVDVEKTKKQIEKANEEYQVILDKVFTSKNIIDTLKSITSQIDTPLVLVSNENYIVFLDEQLGINDNIQINLSSTIKAKLESLESNYKIKQIPDNFDITELDGLKSTIRRLQKDHLVVSSFETDKKDLKIQKIYDEVLKIRTLFLNNINRVSDNDKLEIIYKLYINNVQNNLGKYLNNNTGIIESWKAIFNVNGADTVKTAYELKLKEIKKDILMDTVVNELYSKNKDLFSSYDNFLDKYKDYIIVKGHFDILFSSSSTKTLDNLITFLKSYSTLPIIALNKSNGEAMSDEDYSGFLKDTKKTLMDIQEKIKE